MITGIAENVLQPVVHDGLHAVDAGAVVEDGDGLAAARGGEDGTKGRGGEVVDLGHREGRSVFPPLVSSFGSSLLYP